MAKAGDILHSPNLGETIQFVKTTRETQGALLEVEATYEPNQSWGGGIEHYHPHQDESFEVLEGMISVKTSERESTYVVGEKFDIPKGTIHNMRNLSSKPARIRWQIRPALQTENFLETVWGLSADGKLQTGSLGNLLRLAVVLQAYQDVFRITFPSRIVQKVLLSLLAGIGRLCGYKSGYEPAKIDQMVNGSDTKAPYGESNQVTVAD
ncbi:MAG: cupin domain-containing protein [Chloroflexota bacterium]